MYGACIFTPFIVCARSTAAIERSGAGPTPGVARVRPESCAARLCAPQAGKQPGGGCSFPSLKLPSAVGWASPNVHPGPRLLYSITRIGKTSLAFTMTLSSDQPSSCEKRSNIDRTSGWSLSHATCGAHSITGHHGDYCSSPSGPPVRCPCMENQGRSTSLCVYKHARVVTVQYPGWNADPEQLQEHTNQ